MPLPRVNVFYRRLQHLIEMHGSAVCATSWVKLGIVVDVSKHVLVVRRGKPQDVRS